MPADELFTGYGFITQRDSLIAGGRASNSGLEVTLQQKLSGRIYGLVSGVWERSRYRARDGVWRDRIFKDRFRFAAEGGIRAGAWDVSARWLYAGGVPYTPLDLEASAAQDRSVYDANLINVERYPAYSSLNLRADRRFQVGQTTLRTFLSLWNAYNRKNVDRYYWNTQTQQQDVVTQWSLLPVFGIEWKFYGGSRASVRSVVRMWVPLAFTPPNGVRFCVRPRPQPTLHRPCAGGPVLDDRALRPLRHQQDHRLYVGRPGRRLLRWAQFGGPLRSSKQSQATAATLR